MNAVSGKRVVVAMSGGVDSSVVAAMMLEHGASVVGVTFRFFESDSSESSIIDAQKVACDLCIEHHVVDCVDLFKRNVLDYYEQTRMAGETPSPCVMCNPMVKFKALFDAMHAYDADMIATGHYVRLNVLDDHIALKAAIDRSKDQSYFLYRVNRETLKKCVFPLGNMVNKNETRSLADSYGIHVAEKSDSQDVCFFNTKWYRDFMRSGEIGEIETENGGRIGKHKGAIHYTIGQRKGLGIGGPGEAWFVVGKNAQKNELIVGQGDEQEMLFANRVILTDVNIINNDIEEGEHITAKFRYRQPDVGITVHFLEDNKVEVITDVPTKAITPGQACVFYRGEYCLGSGTIDEVYMNETKRNY